jgi:serine/threonine protein kinase/WD40 repeat protein
VLHIIAKSLALHVVFFSIMEASSWNPFMSDVVGSIIKSYEIKSLLGTGGFGAVYLAQQPAVERDVAIKLILPQYANRPEFIRRFEIEAQTIARLEHPHIVPLYDFWREPEGAFLVMRYLRGGSLRKFTKELLPLNDLCDMMHQIGAALTYSHRHNVIHSDIKTDNIFTDDDGNFYLGDFGIAQSAKTLKDGQTGLYGTPSYLSPEQIRGELLTPASDIYSLGIVMYELLTGVRPFFDFMQAAVIYKQLHEPLPDLRLLRPELPDALNAVLQKATAKLDPARYNDAVAFARDFHDAVGEAEPNAPAATQQPQASMTTSLPKANPFKGLHAFQQSDYRDFFGRDALIDTLYRRLDEMKVEEAFLAVVGPSGSGKSSVVKAGLLPRIQQESTGSYTWYTTEMTPGSQPFAELAAALLSIASHSLPDLEQRLRADKASLVATVHQLVPSDQAGIVLLIDQFEELFTLVAEEDERAHFIDLITHAVRLPASRLKIIITLRADFYDMPLRYPALGRLMYQHTELVLPLVAEEVGEAIRNPAVNVGCVVEEILIDRIVEEMAKQPGALPLLQYTLRELYERRDGRVITLKSYEALGGISGALATTADALYNHYDTDAQHAVRLLFLRLVTTTSEGKNARRRVPQADLLSLGAGRDVMHHVINDCGRARLLTFDHDPTTRSATVEIAHEALIQSWQRLRHWLEEARSALRLHNSLQTACEEWAHNSYNRSYLARGVRLAQFEELAATSDLGLGDLERAFLDASLAERATEEAALREQQQREARQEAISRRRLRLLAISMSALAVLGVLAAVIATTLTQRAYAEQQRAARSAALASSLSLAANARNALVENDPRLALALAKEAASVAQPAAPEVRRTLALATYAPGPVWQMRYPNETFISVDLSPDGTKLVVASLNGTLALIDSATGAALENIAWADVTSAPGVYPTAVQYAPDMVDQALIVGDSAGYLTRYSLATRAVEMRVQPHTGLITALALSDDGSIIVTASTDLFTVASNSQGQRLQRWETVGIVYALDVSARGQQVLAGTGDIQLLNDPNDRADRTLYLWDLASGDLLQSLRPRSGEIRAAAFAPPTEKTLVAAVWDNINGGTLRFYDSATGAEIRRTYVSASPLLSLDFLPDQRLIVTAADRSAHIWDSTGLVLRASFASFDLAPLAVHISANGRRALFVQSLADHYFAPGGGPGSVIAAWDLRSGDIESIYSGHIDPLYAVAVHPARSLIATAGGPMAIPDNSLIDLGIQVWNPTNRVLQARLIGHFDTVTGLEFLGDTLISASRDGNVFVWDVLSASLQRPMPEACSQVNTLIASSDRRRIAIGCADGRVLVGDPFSGEWLQQFHHGSVVHAVVWHPQQEELYFAGEDGGVWRWLFATNEAPQALPVQHTGYVQALAISADGQRLYTGGTDAALYEWWLPQGAAGALFSGHTEEITALTFAGDVLLSGDRSGIVRLWETEQAQELYTYRHHRGRITDLAVFPDATRAISVSLDREAVTWHVLPTADALLSFAAQTRSQHAFTCAQRARYDLEPACQ